MAIAQSDIGQPLILHTRPVFEMSDELFFDFCQTNREWRIERNALGEVNDGGCGLGGPAWFVASRYRGRVTDLDLTNKYVETGKVLCAWVGLGDRIALHQESALSMPFPNDQFTGGYIMHVGMNIEDKTGLCEEIHQALQPGASLGIMT